MWGWWWIMAKGDAAGGVDWDSERRSELRPDACMRAALSVWSSSRPSSIACAVQVRRVHDYGGRRRLSHASSLPSPACGGGCQRTSSFACGGEQGGRRGSILGLVERASLPDSGSL